MSKAEWVNKHIETRILPRYPEMASFIEYLDSEQISDHRVRYIEQLVRVWQRMPGGSTAFEVGSSGPVVQYLNRLGYRIGRAKGDVRYAIDLPDQRADYLLAFDALERIKDQDSKSDGELPFFSFSGVRQFVKEMLRVLKPGGRVLLTTPNATSLHSMLCIMQGRSPAIYLPHVKEYAPEDVIRLFGDQGFECEWRDTFAGTFELGDVSEKLRTYFTQLGHSAEHRGDVAFFVFRKPVATG
jgi:SAM-dependent methyltransferase